MRARMAWIAVPKRAAALGERVGISEAPDPEGERPAVLCRQRGEALHRRPLEPLADHLEQGEGCCCARGRGRGRRRRRGGDRALARRACRRDRWRRAGLAILLIEPRALGEIGGDAWCQRHRISGEQMLPERVGEPLHLVGRRVLRHRRFDPARLGDESRALRRGGQGGDALGHRAGKLAHLGIFGRADHAAVGADRAAIIDRHIVEQPPGDLGAGPGGLRGGGGARIESNKREGQ